MTISEAIIKIEGLMEKDKELARRTEDMGSNLMIMNKNFSTLLLVPPHHDPRSKGRGGFRILAY